MALGYPIFVTDIDPATRRVTLGEKQDLLRTRLTARQINLHGDRVGSVGLRCAAKIRYNHAPQPATVRRTGADEIEVVFDEPQSAVTPGQAVVCYDGPVVLGGGWIETAG